MFTWFGDEVVFITSMFTIYGCYIRFQFTLFTVLYYFHDPPGNASLYENASPAKKSNQDFENDPQQNGGPHIKDNKGPAPYRGAFSLVMISRPTTMESVFGFQFRNLFLYTTLSDQSPYLDLAVGSRIVQCYGFL